MEYDQKSNEKFNLKKQIETFLSSEKAEIIACGTCMKLRQQQSTESCPMGGLEDLYNLVATSGKVLTL